MAKRLSLGKYTNRLITGGSIASPDSKFGLYISKTGVDIDSATSRDELVFNTDTGLSTSRIIGMFQLANATTTQGTDTVDTTVTSGTTATISVPTDDFNFGFGFIGFGVFSSTGETGNYKSTLSYTSNVNNTISIENTGTVTETVSVFILPKFTNVAFF